MPEKIIKATPPEHDPVKHPNHYCYGKFECVEVIQELTAGASGPEGFLLGNVIKYLWRYRRKMTRSNTQIIIVMANLSASK